MSFKLISYEDATTQIDLRETPGSAEGPQTTIIIGPNGSGKSIILSRILDHLEFFHYHRRPDSKAKLPRTDASAESVLKYEMNGAEIVLVRAGRRAWAYADDIEVAIESVPFPSKAIAVAHLPVDRFRFSRGQEAGFYAYLGLRQATNLTTTGALEFKVAASFLTGAGRKGFRQHVGDWLGLLDLGPKISLVMDKIDRHLFEAAIGFSVDFLDRAHDISQRRAGRARTIDRDAFLAENSHDLDATAILFNDLRP